MTNRNDFKERVLSQLTFEKKPHAFYTLYENSQLPELGFIREYHHEAFYFFGVGDYTICQDFCESFTHHEEYLRFGIMYEGVTDFNIDHSDKTAFTPSSFIVLEDSISGTQKWKKGMHYHGAEITLSGVYFRQLVDAFYPNNTFFEGFTKNHTYLFLPLKIIEILQQLEALALQDQLTPLFLHAKVAESLSFIVDELVNTQSNAFINQKKYDRVKLGSNRYLNFTASDIHAVQKAYDIINQNLTEPPTITRLSKMVHINEQKLKAGFQKHYHLSIGQYVQRARMAMAANILSTSDDSLSDISRFMGYAHPSNFTKAFKAIHGKTPLEFRHSRQD